ncbi:MAG TPA: SPOR domain-containing protein [Candidatus Acidoferrales bacterium]|nr:SPOR domain-containing protein [Candidatus Acidoferrales bacterium]
MGNGRRGGDRVLESRHLVGLFLGVVLLCGVFFTLGYVMGRTQYDSSVHAADVDPLHPAVSPKPAPKTSQSEKIPAPNPGEWDFYGKKNNDHLEPAPKSPANRAGGSSAKSISPRPQERPEESQPKLPAHVRPPRMLKNAIVLQIAALRHQGDALALADVLQRKRFPSFVVTPATDAFYRVQVGPYSSEAAAEAAKRALDRQGIKAIIKR